MSMRLITHVARLLGCPSGIAGVFLAVSLAGSAQTVEKVVDLNFGAVNGVGVGGYEPLASPVRVGTNLWFTTDKGGTFDAGTVSRFDLVTREVVQVASFDNDTGKGSESAILVIGDEGYFTTKSGGTGNAGTISRIDFNTGLLQVLHHFPENNAARREAGEQTGASPRAGLVRIGDELWTTTSLGGNSNRGTIVRFNLTDGVTRLVAHLDGPELGGQAFSGFTPSGDGAWYFTTFTGGATFGTTGLPLGAGTLGRLTFDGDGQPLFTRLADLAAGHTQFPGSEPTLVGTNTLYFGTTGPNGAPGSIVRFDLNSGTWTNLFDFTTNAPSVLAHGTRPGYSAFVEWMDELYFLTRQGGSSNLGVVAKYSIAANTVTKLADFEGTEGLALGRATGIFDNTGTIVEEDGRPYLYYLLPTGGVNNRGTIIRVALPSPGSILARLEPAAAGEVRITWTGGNAPFSVEARDAAVAADGQWSVVASGLNERGLVVPLDRGTRIFRVVGTP